MIVYILLALALASAGFSLYKSFSVERRVTAQKLDTEKLVAAHKTDIDAHKASVSDSLKAIEDSTRQTTQSLASGISTNTTALADIHSKLSGLHETPVFGQGITTCSKCSRSVARFFYGSESSPICANCDPKGFEKSRS
jgi:formamidopyrimidine-DNA glycosylase